jgi:hypothetical protein
VQAFYDIAFEREMGLTASEFRRCLPEAFEPLVAAFDATGGDAASVALASGTAHIAWRPMPPRAIALLAALPRVHVRFDFTGVDDAERQRVMKRFDLVMLRGGG